MKIFIRKIQASDLGHLKKLEKWSNSVIHKKKYDWCPTPEDEGSYKSLDSILQSLKGQDGRFERFFILFGNQEVGELGYCLDSPQLFNKKVNGIFFYIRIYEGDEADRKVVLKNSMQYIERQALEFNQTYMEVGVLEFDYQGLNDYKDLKFFEVGRIPKWTYYRGKQWGEVRLGRELSLK